MDDYQQEIVQEEALKVLEIFPKRVIHPLSLNISNLHQMYFSLSCHLCEKLLKSPVYLKCSHRFCKQCIEKYIRNNLKKGCPHCKGQLSTKRDLRTDPNTQALIKALFKDSKVFSTNFEQSDQPLLRSRSGIDVKKTDHFSNQLSSSEIVMPSIKRTRTEGQELNEIPKRGRKKRVPSEKKIESKNIIQPDRQQSSIQKRQFQKFEQRETKNIEKIRKSDTFKVPIKAQAPIVAPSIQIFHHEYISKQRVKKKKIPIIDLDSESEVRPEKEIEGVRNQEFLVEDKNICSISVLAQNQEKKLEQVESRMEIQNEQKRNAISFKQFAAIGKKPIQNNVIIKQKQKNITNAKKTDPVKPTQKTNKNTLSQQNRSIKNQVQFNQSLQQQFSVSVQKNISNKMEAEPEAMNIEPTQFFAKKPNVSEKALAAIQILKNRFGQHYIQRIVQLSPFSFYVSISLNKLSDNILIPEVIFPNYKINLKSQLSSVASIIAKTLNIEKSFVFLFIKKDSQTIKLDHGMSLLTVNQNYWQKWSNIDLFQFSDLVDWVDDGKSRKAVESSISGFDGRTIFYQVNIDAMLT